MLKKEKWGALIFFFEREGIVFAILKEPEQVKNLPKPTSSTFSVHSIRACFNENPKVRIIP